MLRYLIAYCATALTFMACDACWLTFAGPMIYKPVLGQILADKVDLGAAIAFYVIYIAGLVVFAVRPALAAQDWRTAAVSGLLLGLFAYATYDFTNQATLRVWSLRITLADLAWGMALSALASTVGFLAASRVAR